MPTTQAHRVRKARKLIADAYALNETDFRERVLRVELLGDSIAVARIRVDGLPMPVIRVAQRQSSGRVVRLLRENRENFASVRKLTQYLEELYARYGGPKGEPPTAQSAEGGGLKLVR